MTTSTPDLAKRKPTHIAYVVHKKTEKESSWTEVGALWRHADSQGFNLVLKAIPLGGELVIREAKNAKLN